jgi:hypothetical protein
MTHCPNCSPQLLRVQTLWGMATAISASNIPSLPLLSVDEFLLVSEPMPLSAAHPALRQRGWLQSSKTPEGIFDSFLLSPPRVSPKIQNPHNLAPIGNMFINSAKDSDGPLVRENGERCPQRDKCAAALHR